MTQPVKRKGIIVLGGGRADYLTRMRARAAAEFYHKYGPVPILASGGKGLLWDFNGNREWTEADVAVETLLNEDVKCYDIRKDKNARTTVENFRGAIAWILEQKVTDAYIATNAGHMLRSLAVAKRIFIEDDVDCNLHPLPARIRSAKDAFAEIGVLAYETLYAPPRALYRAFFSKQNSL